MATRKRTRRSHSRLTAYKVSELLTGEMQYGLRHYNGYGDVDSGATRAADFISDAMRHDWKQYGAELVEFWISGQWTVGHTLLTPQSDPVIFPPYIFLRGSAGTRPWAWWQFEAPEPIGEDEDETDYLERHGLLSPAERGLLVEQIEAGIADLKSQRDYLAGPGPHCWAADGGAERLKQAARLDERIVALGQTLSPWLDAGERKKRGLPAMIQTPGGNALSYIQHPRESVDGTAGYE